MLWLAIKPLYKLEWMDTQAGKPRYVGAATQKFYMRSDIVTSWALERSVSDKFCPILFWIPNLSFLLSLDLLEKDCGGGWWWSDISVQTLILTKLQKTVSLSDTWPQVSCVMATKLALLFSNEYLSWRPKYDKPNEPNNQIFNFSNFNSFWKFYQRGLCN